MAVSTVILCLAICISDAIIMISMNGRMIKYIMSQPFSALHCERVNQYGCALRSSDSKPKRTSFG